MWKHSVAVLIGAALLAAQSPKYGVGHPATEEQIRGLGTAIAPDVTGLPAGSGTVAAGREIFAARCAKCHGEKATGDVGPPLVGGKGTLATAKPLKTVGSYWPYATTVWDYISRAMPFDQPGLLKPPEVYALVAYILNLNGIIGNDQVMDSKSLPQVKMPNRNGFVADPRPDVGKASPSSNQPAPRPTIDEVKKRIASQPPDQQIYELFRFWLVDQPPDVQRLFGSDATQSKGYDLYRNQLRAEGDPAGEIERKLRVIEKEGERLEIDRWNQVLTSNSPRINWKPNGFLVEMVQGRKPGRALDVGMGQGRNALWLAQQGWDTTGYDPAERAVALARENASKLGLKLSMIVAKDSEFDLGVAKWDLILLSYVEIRENAARAVRALAPGGIVVAEYFHQDSKNAPGGFADNELVRLFDGLRIVRYEDTEAVADFGMQKTRLVRICAEKR